MSVKNGVFPVARASFNTTGLTTSYKVVNTNGLEEPCFMLRITNDSNADVSISYDGSTDHDYLRTGEVLQISTQPSDSRANFRNGTKIYVKGAGAGTGFIYLAGYYQPNFN